MPSWVRSDENQGPIEVESGNPPPTPSADTQLRLQMRHIRNPLGVDDDRSSCRAKAAPPQALENRDLAMAVADCH